MKKLLSISFCGLICAIVCTMLSGCATVKISEELDRIAESHQMSIDIKKVLELFLTSRFQVKNSSANGRGNFLGRNSCGILMEIQESFR